MTRSEYYLHELLTPNQEQALIDGASTYSLIKLRLYQKGVELRQTKLGSELGSKQFIAKQGQFIISKIDARNGAMGLVPENLDRAVVTGDFLLFDFNEKLVDSSFFEYYTRLRDFDHACKLSSEGSTNRVRLKIDKFLNIKVSLPSIEEQKRIIAIVDNVRRNLDEINKIRIEQTKDFKNLLFSKYSEIIEGADWYPMRIVAPIVRRDVVIDESALYPEVGIRSFGKGTFHKPALTGLEVGTKTLYQVKSGDLLFSNVFAWEGAIAVVKNEDDNRYGSHRFISCEVDKNQAVAEFLCYHFLTPKGLEDINHASPGGAGRNKTLGLEKLMRINVPVPNIELQKEFVELFHKIEALREHHKQTEKELGELMPSLLDKAFKGEL